MTEIDLICPNTAIPDAPEDELPKRLFALSDIARQNGDKQSAKDLIDAAGFASVALSPPVELVSASEHEDGAVVSGHTAKCWGRTSYSDEMAHCYCPKPSNAHTLETPEGVGMNPEKAIGATS